LVTPINILKKITLFASLAEADLQNLASLLRRKSLTKGEILFRQGDEGTALYVILQGRIKISVSRRMDKMTLAILGQGEFLGEMALLDGLPRSADAMAMEDSHLYALNYNTPRKLDRAIRCMLGFHRPKEECQYGREHAKESRCGI